MTEVIENTLNILTRITNCKAILLLKFNDDELSVLSFLGNNSEKYEQFYDSLFQHYNSFAFRY